MFPSLNMRSSLTQLWNIDGDSLYKKLSHWGLEEATPEVPSQNDLVKFFKLRGFLLDFAPFFVDLGNQVYIRPEVWTKAYLCWVIGQVAGASLVRVPHQVRTCLGWGANTELDYIGIEGHDMEDNFCWEALFNVVLASFKAGDGAKLGAIDIVQCLLLLCLLHF